MHLCVTLLYMFTDIQFSLSYTDISTTRLELFYILHRRLGFFTMFKSPVSVFLQLRRVFLFFSFSSNQPQSMLLSNRAGKIELGCCCCCCCRCWRAPAPVITGSLSQRCDSSISAPHSLSSPVWMLVFKVRTGGVQRL